MGFKLTDLNLSRTVFLFDQFFQDTAEDLIQKLVTLDAQANDDITIVVNSYGGSVYALLSIIDTVKNLKSNVNTVCLGIAASCGAVLFALGKKRYIGENSKVMIHQVSSFLYGTTKEMENTLEEVKDLNDKLFNILLERSNLEEKEMRKIFEKDSYLDAKTVIKNGLADEIIEEPKEEDDKDTNVFYNSTSKDFINSFNGFSRDGAFAIAMASKGSTTVFKSVNFDKTKVKNLIKKGEKVMNLDEIKANLKDEFKIDVDALTNEVSELKASIVENETTIATLTSEKEALEANHKNEKIEGLLNKLIDDEKSTQVLNEGYRVMFNNMSFEDAEKFCANLKKIVKTAPVGNSANDNEDDGEILDKEKAKLSIQALADEKKISFSQAAIEFYRKEK